LDLYPRSEVARWYKLRRGVPMGHFGFGRATDSLEGWNEPLNGIAD